MSAAPLFTPAFARLLAVNMAFHFSFSIFHLLPKYMAVELSAAPSHIGAVTTLYGLANIASVPLVGGLLDRFTRARVLLFGAALFALTSFAFIMVDSVGVSLFALRALQGVSLSLFVSAGSVLSAESAPPDRMAQAIGLFAGSGMIMTAIATSLGEQIAAQHGYAPVFAIAGAAALGASLLALRVDDTPSHGAAQRGSLRSLVLRATSLRMAAVLSITGLGFGVMFAFSAPFSLELGLTNVRGFFVAFTAAALCVRVGCGSLIDRTGHRRTATCALFGYAATVGAMVLLTPGRLALLGFLFGIAHGLFIPAFTAFVVSEAAPHERAKVLTLFHGAFNVGQCLVLALGVAAERWGYRSVFASTGALILAAPLLLLGWPHAGERRHRAVERAPSPGE